MIVSSIIVILIIIGGVFMLCVISYVLGWLKGHTIAKVKYQGRITELNQKVFDLLNVDTIDIDPNQTKMKLK